MLEFMFVKVEFTFGPLCPLCLHDTVHVGHSKSVGGLHNKRSCLSVSSQITTHTHTLIHIHTTTHTQTPLTLNPIPQQSTAYIVCCSRKRISHTFAIWSTSYYSFFFICLTLPALISPFPFLCNISSSSMLPELLPLPLSFTSSPREGEQLRELTGN